MDDGGPRRPPHQGRTATGPGTRSDGPRHPSGPGCVLHCPTVHPPSPPRPPGGPQVRADGQSGQRDGRDRHAPLPPRGGGAYRSAVGRSSAKVMNGAGGRYSAGCRPAPSYQSTSNTLDTPSVSTVPLSPASWAARKAWRPSMAPAGERLPRRQVDPGDQAVDAAVGGGPDPAADHAVVGSVVDGVDGGVARAGVGPDPGRVAEEVDAAVGPLLHGPQRARGDGALGLVLARAAWRPRGRSPGRCWPPCPARSAAGRRPATGTGCPRPVRCRSRSLLSSVAVGRGVRVRPDPAPIVPRPPPGPAPVPPCPAQVPAPVGNHPDTAAARAARPDRARPRRPSAGRRRRSATVSPGASWPSTREVGGDHAGDDRVAAHRGVVGEEDDRPAVGRHLHGTGHHRRRGPPAGPPSGAGPVRRGRGGRRPGPPSAPTPTRSPAVEAGHPAVVPRAVGTGHDPQPWRARRSGGGRWRGGPAAVRVAPGQAVADAQRARAEPGQHVRGPGARAAPGCRARRPRRGRPAGRRRPGRPDHLAVRHRHHGAVGHRAPVDGHLDRAGAGPTTARCPSPDHPERRARCRCTRRTAAPGRCRGAGWPRPAPAGRRPRPGARRVAATPRPAGVLDGVEQPGSSTSRHGAVGRRAAAAAGPARPCAGGRRRRGRRRRRRTGPGRPGPPGSTGGTVAGRTAARPVRPSRFQPPGVAPRVDGGEPTGHRHRAGGHRRCGAWPDGGARPARRAARSGRGTRGRTPRTPPRGRRRPAGRPRRRRDVPSRVGHLVEVGAVEDDREHVGRRAARPAAAAVRGRGPAPARPVEPSAAAAPRSAPSGSGSRTTSTLAKPTTTSSTDPGGAAPPADPARAGGQGVGGGDVAGLDQERPVAEGHHPACRAGPSPVAPAAVTRHADRSAGRRLRHRRRRPGLERAAHGPGPALGPGVVAVEAQRLDLERHPGAVDGDDPAARRPATGPAARRRPGRRRAPRASPRGTSTPVRVVAAVAEPLGHHAGPRPTPAGAVTALAGRGHQHRAAAGQRAAPRRRPPRDRRPCGCRGRRGA